MRPTVSGAQCGPFMGSFVRDLGGEGEPQGGKQPARPRVRPTYWRPLATHLAHGNGHGGGVAPGGR